MPYNMPKNTTPCRCSPLSTGSWTAEESRAFDTQVANRRWWIQTKERGKKLLTLLYVLLALYLCHGALILAVLGAVLYLSLVLKINVVKIIDETAWDEAPDKIAKVVNDWKGKSVGHTWASSLEREKKQKRVGKWGRKWAGPEML